MLLTSPRLSSNPVLEAFGNAKTVRNNNSSRFGKFVEIQFDKQGRISGAAIRTYLLERSGVCQVSDPEHNYHCFYLLCGGPAEVVEKYKLGSSKTFHYLNQSKCHELVGVNDTQEYLATRRAMDIVGISETEQEAIFRVAAILLVGNIELAKGTEVDSSILKDDQSKFHFQTAVELLKCDTNALEDALLKRVMVTPEEVIKRSLDTVAAVVGRDGVAKTLYSWLFDWICFLDSAFVSCRNPSFSPVITSKKGNKPLPVETTFNIPAPIPKWPSGNGFASRTIDLGELKVSRITTFNKVWTAYEGGPSNLGATFYEPISIPQGFSILGYYSQPNNQALDGWVIVAKDVRNDQSRQALTLPTDYTLVWSSDSLKIKQDGIGYIWLPVPSNGYKAVGHVVTNSSEKPSLDKIRCVRSDLTEDIETDNWIWGPKSSFNVHSSRPAVRGIHASSVAIGTFVAKKDGDSPSLSCLMNIKNDLSSMPNLNQIQALFKAYSPVVYFHPKDQIHGLESSTKWIR